MVRSSMDASPDTGRCRPADIVGKFPRRTSQRALDAIGQRRVAAVEHDGEEVDDQVGVHAGHAVRDELATKILRRDRDEPDIPSGRLCDLADRLGEGQSV